jgi:hypothetical protein
MVEQMKRHRCEFRDSKPWRLVQEAWRAFSARGVAAAGLRAVAIIRAGYPLLFGGALL